MTLREELEELRQTVLRNAHHRCCVCYSEEKIQIHHIDKTNKHNVIDNMSVLCGKHHDMAHYTGRFSCKLKPSAIKKYMLDWTGYVKKERIENSGVVRIPKDQKNEAPPNHIKYELVENSVEEIIIPSLFLSLIKTLISVFAYCGLVYVFYKFDLIDDPLISLFIPIAGAVLVIPNMNNFSQTLVLFKIFPLKINTTVIFSNSGRLAMLDENKKYFFYKMRASCIAPECNGHVIPAIAPVRERHRGLIGLCAIGKTDHAYTIDANGVGERITLYTRPIERKK